MLCCNQCRGGKKTSVVEFGISALAALRPFSSSSYCLQTPPQSQCANPLLRRRHIPPCSVILLNVKEQPTIKRGWIHWWIWIENISRRNRTLNANDIILQFSHWSSYTNFKMHSKIHCYLIWVIWSNCHKYFFTWESFAPNEVFWIDAIPISNNITLNYKR